MSASGTGTFEEIGHVDGPDDLKGPQAKHRWVAIVGYSLEEREIERSRLQGVSLQLGRSNLVMGPDIGCIACEQPYSEATAATPCPGEPPGTLEYVPDEGN